MKISLKMNRYIVENEMTGGGKKNGGLGQHGGLLRHARRCQSADTDKLHLHEIKIGRFAKITLDCTTQESTPASVNGFRGVRLPSTER